MLPWPTEIKLCFSYLKFAPSLQNKEVLDGPLPKWPVKKKKKNYGPQNGRIRERNFGNDYESKDK